MIYSIFTPHNVSTRDMKIRIINVIKNSELIIADVEKCGELYKELTTK